MSESVYCFDFLINVIIFHAVLGVGNGDETTPVELPKKLYITPPSANRIQLPDGRHLAYEEQGVSAERARFSLITPHSFLSSRLAGRIDRYILSGYIVLSYWLRHAMY
jgi:hypothetical protein